MSSEGPDMLRENQNWIVALEKLAQLFRTVQISRTMHKTSHGVRLSAQANDCYSDNAKSAISLTTKQPPPPSSTPSYQPCRPFYRRSRHPHLFSFMRRPSLPRTSLRSRGSSSSSRTQVAEAISSVASSLLVSTPTAANRILT